MPTSRPQIMILGTYHMDNPNLDAVKTQHTDVLTEPRQQQIKDLVSRLVAFAPTHVAVEVLPQRMEIINSRYQRFLEGGYTLTRNEVDQVAFRLAQALGHGALYGVDFHQEIGLDAVFQYIEAHGLTEIRAEFGRFMAQMEATTKRVDAEGTVIDLLRHHNSAEHDSHHQIYLRSTLVGAGDTWVGADMAAAWYARNLKMYANILGLAQRPEDRILVLVGAGHGPLLREFLRQAPQVELVHPAPYLA